MNKDEVLNMPAGREMDVLIAKEIFGNVKNSWDWEFTLPSYSTDNSAAYDLEAEIFEKGFAVEYCNSLIHIINKEQNLRVVGDWVQYYYISHATAHEKCRAALLAVVPVTEGGVQQSVHLTWGILPVSKHFPPPKRIPSPKGRRRQPRAGNANRWALRGARSKCERQRNA